MSPDELLPPLTLSGWWLVAGLLACATLTFWGLARAYAYFRGLPARARLAPAPPDVRRSYCADVHRLEAKVNAGAISQRAAAQELVRLVRAFAATVTGLDATPMTLRDLRAHPRLRPAAALIARLYAREFDRDVSTDVRPELRAARRLAEQWR